MDNEVGYLVVADIKENEDGSATYQINMDDASSKKITELGLEFALTCAAYSIDIQDALRAVVEFGKKESGCE